MQLLDVRVERTADVLEPEDPLVRGRLPGGRVRISAVPERAVLRVDGVGTFEVEGGTRIGFAPEPGARRGPESRFLRATVAGLLLAQRGQFALHASAVAVAGVAVALCGPRGAGKSTTALRLEQRGHTLVTDDLTPVALAERTVMVEPLAQEVRVFAETARRLELDTSAAEPGPSKLLMPVEPGPPRPLGAIVVLSRGDEVAARPLRGVDAGWAVARNAYRGALVRKLWEKETFEWAAAVAAQVPVYELSRPADSWTVDAVADAVERIAR